MERLEDARAVIGWDADTGVRDGKTEHIRRRVRELVNDDGSVKRGAEVAAFAKLHKLAQVSIADIIAWRQAREKLVERVATFPVKSVIGELSGYAFVTPFDAVHHMAFVYGKIGDGKNILARLHRANVVSDVFGDGKSVRKSRGLCPRSNGCEGSKNQPQINADNKHVADTGEH